MYSAEWEESGGKQPTSEAPALKWDGCARTEDEPVMVAMVFYTSPKTKREVETTDSGDDRKNV